MEISSSSSPADVTYESVLPGPHLNIAGNTAVSYWFTYSSQDVACDSTTYPFTTAA